MLFEAFFITLEEHKTSKLTKRIKPKYIFNPLFVKDSVAQSTWKRSNLLIWSQIVLSHTIDCKNAT